MRSTFIRKVAYMVVALVLFAAMLALRPKIEEIRHDPRYRLAEETLATPQDVDMTGATAILVLGGLRGIAADILWNQANELQKKQQFTEIEPVVESIIKLQPHFIRVWTFQGWNLAYNISVEWDAVEDKYYWIKRGIRFIRRGTEVNRHSPELRWDTGWTYFHKIGKSDEAALLRKMYREDVEPELDAQGNRHEAFNPEGEDNFMTAKSWFSDAVRTLDQEHARPKRMSDVPFRSYPAHAQTDYSIAREEDGQFGEVVQRDWLDAYLDWQRFADYEYLVFETKKVKLDYPPEILQPMIAAIAMRDRMQAVEAALAKGTDAAQPEEQREQIERDWRSVREETPVMLRDFGDPAVYMLRVNEDDTAAREAREAVRTALAKLPSPTAAAPLTQSGPEGDALRQLAAELAAALQKLGSMCHEELYWMDRYANMVNYPYWRERSQAEAEMETIEARMHFYNAEQRYRQGDPETARQEYEDGLALWEKVLDRHERIRDDDLTQEDTVKIVHQYLKVLEQLDEPRPETLPFEDIVRKLAPPVYNDEMMQVMSEMQQAFQKLQDLPPEEQEKKKQEMMGRYEELRQKAEQEAVGRAATRAARPKESSEKTADTPPEKP